MQNGMHPILLGSGRNAVPLSFDLSDGDNFLLITGANMVGGMETR